MPNVSEQTKLQHLLLRAGFGASLSEIANYQVQRIEKVAKQLLQESVEVRPLTIVDGNELKVGKFLFADKDEKKEMIKDSISKIKDLNLMWLDRMTESKGVLREKMTLFWHGHFACESKNVYFIQNQNNTLRKHALGKFGDLLHAISKDPAMLQYLNNKQNKKDSPNENFAREVMELFTLGRGNYTENDIKNAARAFTGWDFDQNGAFIFRKFKHDFDEKTFFGKTGNFSGEDILNMILENKQTAKFITTKIYKYFVNEKLDENIINTLAEKFFQSNYDIGALMEEIFTSAWFYDAKNIGSRIKSPVEYLTTIRKQFNLSFSDKDPLIFLQKILGQMLFFPPNVAGWQEGRAWIDSSTLVIRTMLPQVLYRMVEIPIQPKEEGDVNADFIGKKKLQTIKATYDWSAFVKNFGNEKTEKLNQQLAEYLLQVPLSAHNQALIIKIGYGKTSEEAMKEASMMLTTLPEYQMC